MRKYDIRGTKAYRKDYKRLAKSGCNMQKLQTVVDILASGDPLSDQYRDHPLHGPFEGSQECHIGPDWLLRYKKDDGRLILILIRTGTHRDVLGIE